LNVTFPFASFSSSEISSGLAGATVIAPLFKYVILEIALKLAERKGMINAFDLLEDFDDETDPTRSTWPFW
jgi:hypothetical protein